VSREITIEYEDKKESPFLLQAKINFRRIYYVTFIQNGKCGFLNWFQVLN